MPPSSRTCGRTRGRGIRAYGLDDGAEPGPRGGADAPAFGRLLHAFGDSSVLAELIIERAALTPAHRSKIQLAVAGSVVSS